MSRSELFGRASPEPTSTPALPSRAVERMAGRQGASVATIDSEIVSSPLARFQQEEPRALRRQSSPSKASLHSSRSFGRNSMMGLRSIIAGGEVTQDECFAAGSPEPEMSGSGYGPGPTVRSKKNYFSDAGENVGGMQAGPRKTSLAEDALRSTLASKAQPSKPPHDRTSSWASRLFSRRSPVATPQPPLKPAISDENISEFEYVQPRSFIESPEAILDRIRARNGTADEHTRTPSSNVGSARYSKKSETEIKAHDGQAPTSPHHAESLLSLDASSVHDSVSNGNITPSTMSLDTLPPQFSDEEEVSQDARPEEAHEQIEGPVQTTSFPATTAVNLSLSPITTVAEKTPCSQNQGLAPSVMSPVFDQEPQMPQSNLTMSAVTEVFFQEPLTPAKHKGLTFAAANAIIYGCTTLATVLFILLNITEEFRCGDLAADMGIAFVIGFVSCVVVHTAGGGDVQSMLPDMPRFAWKKTRKA